MCHKQTGDDNVTVYAEIVFDDVLNVLAKNTSFIKYDIRLVLKVKDLDTELWWNLPENKQSPVSHDPSSNLDTCDLNIPCKLVRFDLVQSYLNDIDGEAVESGIYLYMALEITGAESNSTNAIYVFIVTYSAYLDLLLLMVVFGSVAVLNARLSSRAYYQIFSQINLFTHKLQHYTDYMLKPQELSPFSLDDLLFPESSELSDFFIEFFEGSAKLSKKSESIRYD